MSKRNGTNIDLTAKQRKAAEMLANPDFDGTKTDLIEAVGVPRTTFYRWIKDKKFMEYTCKLIEQYTDAELGAVWKALIQECKKGNVQAIKLFFELRENTSREWEKLKMPQCINLQKLLAVMIHADKKAAGGC